MSEHRELRSAYTKYSVLIDAAKQARESYAPDKDRKTIEKHRLAWLQEIDRLEELVEREEYLKYRRPGMTPIEVAKFIGMPPDAKRS